MAKIDNNKISITFLISAIAIIIIQNFNVDNYFKYFSLPFIVLTISYTYLLKDKILNKKSLYLLIPIFLILLSNVFIKTDEANLYLNILIIPVLVTSYLFYLTNKNFYLSRNTLSWLFYIFPEGILKNLEELKFKKNIDIKNIFIGILISIGFCIVLIGLLMSADKYFSTFIENIIDKFNFEMILKNVISFIIYFIILFGTFINLIKNENKKVEKTKLDTKSNITIQIILWSVNMVFMLFIISEISKITNNFLKIPIEYTYAEYAREGFFQLICIVIINIAIIVYNLYFIDNIKNNKVIKNLILTLIGFSIILIFNSYYRMFLYIGHFGWTILRLQVILFLTMLIIIFVIFLKKIINGLKYNDFNYYVIIMLVFYIINLYLCNSLFINII